MLQTTNYSLNKPEGSDVVDISVLNANFDTIDTTMKTLDTKSATYAVTSGSANTYTATISGVTNYFAGLRVCVQINATSTGNSTLNINGLGAKTILDSLGNQISNGGLKANIPYQLCYNGSNFIVLGKGGGGNADPTKLLSGYTATVDNGQITGTLDLSNLVSGNIRSGVTINGISGSSTVVDTADAVLDSQFLVSGYSGYDDGVKKTGTMPNLGNSQNAVDTWQSGNGQLVFRVPSVGAFTGVVNGYKPEVSSYDSNFIASNIISGKSIFGVNGSAIIESLGGAYKASGSIYRTQSLFTISGLSFTPNLVICSSKRDLAETYVFAQNFDSSWTKEQFILYYDGWGQDWTMNTTAPGGGNPIIFNSDGFTFKAMGGYADTVYWRAFKV